MIVPIPKKQNQNKLHLKLETLLHYPGGNIWKQFLHTEYEWAYIVISHAQFSPKF